MTVALWNTSYLLIHWFLSTSSRPIGSVASWDKYLVKIRTASFSIPAYKNRY